MSYPDKRIWLYITPVQMEEILSRVGEDLANRIGGPMTFRFMLQPAVALFLGFRDGLRFGRAGTPILRWGRGRRRVPGIDLSVIGLMWRSVRALLFIALTLDLIYQVVVQGWFYPGETVIVGVAITLVPYLLVCATVSVIVYYRSRLKER